MIVANRFQNEEGGEAGGGWIKNIYISIFMDR